MLPTQQQSSPYSSKMGICVKILQLCDAMLRGGLTSMFLAPGSILFLDNTLTLPRSPIAKRKKNLMKKPLYILTLKLLHHVFFICVSYLLNIIRFFCKVAGYGPQDRFIIVDHLCGHSEGGTLPCLGIICV